MFMVSFFLYSSNLPIFTVYLRDFIASQVKIIFAMEERVINDGTSLSTVWSIIDLAVSLSI